MSQEYTLPALEAMQREIARDLKAAFDRADLKGVYADASRIAPRLYPPKAKLSGDDLAKATDLLADAFLVLGAKRR